MILVFWKNYSDITKYDSDFACRLSSDLEKNGFIKKSIGPHLKFVKPNGMRRGPPPVFHIIDEGTVEIFSRPHLGASMPFTIFVLLAAYSIFIEHLFVAGQEFHIAGLVFFLFVVGVLNLVTYLLFHSDVEAFNKVLENVSKQRGPLSRS